MECHSIRPDQYDVQLLDQYKTPLTAEYFKRVINRYSCCSDFFIELKCTLINEKKDSPKVIREVMETSLKISG